MKVNCLAVMRNLRNDYMKISTAIEKTSPLNFADSLYIAVLSAEDKYFFSHKGFSIKSLIRAIIKRHGGASTIDMQLVRTITNRKEITIKRKLREILLAVCIEIKFSKKQILDCYLENAYYGYNLTGLRSVLISLKKSNPQCLTIKECCYIAALLKRPFNPSRYSEWVRRVNVRINYIYKQYFINEKKMSIKIKSSLK